MARAIWPAPNGGKPSTPLPYERSRDADGRSVPNVRWGDQGLGATFWLALPRLDYGAAMLLLQMPLNRSQSKTNAEEHATC